MKIYISGLYSGTNPQPGVGIARSLRQAYPEAELIGVEYSNRCSGIHWRDFDEIWLQRPWQELNLDTHAAEITRADFGFRALTWKFCGLRIFSRKDIRICSRRRFWR